MNSLIYGLRSGIPLLFGFFLLLICVAAEVGISQTLQNGEFDDGMNGWFAWGECNIATSDDSYASGSACLVTERTEFWNGAAQDMQGKLEVGQDYHVEAWVKPVGDASGTMRLLLYQIDDRGERGIKIGETVAASGQWTHIQGGFTYDPVGDVDVLLLGIDSSEHDPQTFDFLVDSVSITENNWRPAADARIEQIRKRDVSLNFARSNGQPARNLSVSAVQVSHAFPFGSTLNWRFETDEVYRDFFKQHFDWATIEWHSQWKPVETAQGVEDYATADASVDFCEQNGIQVKGHALFWPSEEFRPTWLSDLSDSQLLDAMEQRVMNAVTRFGSRLYGWDVNNEMLNYTFFQDRLGESIRPWMFKRARELESNVQLFVNEYGLEYSEAKTDQYRELVDSLLASGADVSGVGFQSHYNGMASPKGIELAMDKFRDTGLGIWFTEYDTVHPDPVRRAQSLENFYRFAFSCPETKGIIMWGFWAGSHWQGPDASLVDLDWTVNAAGERYFELMDEWTTEVDGSTGGTGQFDFRGFHGTYLVTTADAAGIVNYHLVPIGNGTDATDVALKSNPFNGSLSIYGTAADDLFEFDLATPRVVKINGSPVNFELPVGVSDVRFVGLDGEDRVKIRASEDAQNLFANESRLIVRGVGLTVRFEDVANVEIIAASQNGRVTVADSAGDDVFESFDTYSTMTSSNRVLSVAGFGNVAAYSSFGSDVALVFDSPFVDEVVTDLNFVNVTQGQIVRQVSEFAENIVASSMGQDLVEVRLPNGDKSIEVSPESIEVTVTVTGSGSSFRFNTFPKATLFAEEGNADTVSVVGGEAAETLRIAPNASLYYSGDFRYVFHRDLRNFEYLSDSPGSDRLIYRDTAGDDNLSVNGNSMTITGDGYSHSFQFLNEIYAFSRAGGTDSATVSDPSRTLRLVGDWNSEE